MIILFLIFRLATPLQLELALEVHMVALITCIWNLTIPIREEMQCFLLAQGYISVSIFEIKDNIEIGQHRLTSEKLMGVVDCIWIQSSEYSRARKIFVREHISSQEFI